MLAAAGNMWIAAGQPGKAALALDRALAGTGLPADQRGLALLDRARAAEAQGDLKAARRFADLGRASAAEDPFTVVFLGRAGDPRGRRADRQGWRSTARWRSPPTTPTILFEAGHVAQAEGDMAARARLLAAGRRRRSRRRRPGARRSRRSGWSTCR